MLGEVFAIFLLLAGVHLTTRYSYLLFHSIAELFSIFISVTVFIIVINCWESIRNQYLLFIGISNFFIGLIDLLHTLSYKGMGIFNDYDYYAPQFWIAGRYLESVCLLLAFTALGAEKPIKKFLVFPGCFLTTSLLVASILYFKNFPSCFVAGQGLTEFKIISEYVICAILTLNVLILNRLKHHFEPREYQLIHFSLLFMIAMELCFTQYVTDTMSDMFNELGHLFKIIAFYLIYKALVVTAIRKPINLLFHDLKISQDQLLEAQALAKVGRWEWQLPNGIWRCTNEIYRILELPPATPINTETFLSKLKASSREDFQALLDQTRFNDQPFELSLILESHRDCHYAQLKGEVFRNTQGQVEKLVGTLQDVTTQQQMMKALQAAKQAADSANAAKSTFLANMSHEIRTPMNAIIGFTYLLRRELVVPKQVERLNKINESAEHLLEIINDILDFSKIEADRLTLESTDFNLDELFKHIYVLTSNKVELKGLEMISRIDPALPRFLCGDRVRLGQILLNLVNNALKFTESGTVILRARFVNQTAQDLWIRFEVSDTGIGLSETQCQTLFQPFTQADASISRKFGGTGLGLAISKRLVELMEGKIGVESVEGHGCTFWFEVRFSKSVVVADSLPQIVGRKLELLVVDDVEEAREAIADCLNSQNVLVTMADSGKMALVLIEEADQQKRPYDLVLLDCKMPEMDGIETARKIHALPFEQVPPVILVTPYDHEYPKEILCNTSIVDVITKPFTSSTLMEAILGAYTGQKTLLNKVVKGELDLSSLKGRRILLAEDNKVNQDITLEILHDAGLITDLAENGEQAIVLAKKNEYDLILLDVQMPVMDGLEACRHLRQLKAYQAKPILALTANAFAEDRKICLEAGMNEHIVKPLNPDILYLTLLRWLGNLPRIRVQSNQTIFPIQQTTSSKGADPLDALSVISGFNPEKGLKIVGNNLQRYFHVLKIYYEVNKKTSANFNLFLENKDFANLEFLAHSLKGSSANIGAENIRYLSAQIEKSAQQGDLEGLLTLINDLTNQLGLLLQKLSSMLNTNQLTIAPETALSPITQAEYQRVTGQLLELLTSEDLSARKYYREVRSVIGVFVDKTIVERLDDLIERFSYSEAIQLLDGNDESS